MGEQLSVINLVANASVPVQIVIAMLVLASLYSWMIIFRKRFVIRRSRREAEQFENQFWSGGDLAQLYRAIESRGGALGMASIFEFGFREFARLRQQSSSSDYLKPSPPLSALAQERSAHVLRADLDVLALRSVQARQLHRTHDLQVWPIALTTCVSAPGDADNAVDDDVAVQHRQPLSGAERAVGPVARRRADGPVGRRQDL